MMGPDDPDGGDPDDEEPDGEEPDSGDSTGVPTSLSHMTKSELLDYAEEQGITGLDGLTKAQIIEEVEHHVSSD